MDLIRRMTNLPEYEADWLERELGIGPIDRSSTFLRPNWLRSELRLFYRDQLCRTIHRPRTAYLVITILDSFEAAGWPRRVPNPFSGIKALDALKAGVASLNSSIVLLKFHTDGDGVRWDLDGPQP